MPDDTYSLPGQFWRILGERIKERRRELKRTQLEVSAAVEISRAALANIETGKQRTSVFLLARLAKVMKISPGNLIPDLSEAEERLQRVRRTSVFASDAKLLTRELENLNIAVEPHKGGLQNALREVRRHDQNARPRATGGQNERIQKNRPKSAKTA